MPTTKLKHMLAGLVALLTWATILSAQAYDVERNTSANRIYMLLLNDNPGAVYHSISISETVPTFVGTVVASIVPAAVNGGSSDLAALDFDVKPSASVGATGTIEITVAGQAAGVAINVVFTVPLDVVNSAPAAQGFVGTGEPTPNPGGTDTDGDGIPDSLEVAYGSDPYSASSIPGQVDTDDDGIEDSSDSAPNDPCVPSVFNATCMQDTDGDGKSDGSEGELTDTDGDGTPDYLESSMIDDDSDGFANEVDAANTDPCNPDPLAINCMPAEVRVPILGLPGYLLLGLLLTALGIKLTQRQPD